MTQKVPSRQWPKFAGRTAVRVPTPHGSVTAQLAVLATGPVLVYTGGPAVEVPLVRFQSACVFGEGLRATDCDCGEQLIAAIKTVCEEGGVITYAWEEGRGAGIARKLEAIALEQERALNTANAYKMLGLEPEPRTFENHVAALRLVFSGTKVRLASRNPAKIAALHRAGIDVIERITLRTPMTEERTEYLAAKLPALGHFS